MGLSHLSRYLWWHSCCIPGCGQLASAPTMLEYIKYSRPEWKCDFRLSQSFRLIKPSCKGSKTMIQERRKIETMLGGLRGNSGYTFWLLVSEGEFPLTDNLCSAVWSLVTRACCVLFLRLYLYFFEKKNWTNFFLSGRLSFTLLLPLLTPLPHPTYLLPVLPYLALSRCPVFRLWLQSWWRLPPLLGPVSSY